MKMRKKNFTRMFNKLMTYSPVFIIWALVGFICAVYVLEYILVLMKVDLRVKNYSNMIIVNYFPNDPAFVGFVLFTTINFTVSMMLISMFRAIFMDPGYLPDPLQFEYKLVRKNLEYPESSRRSLVEGIQAKDLNNKVNKIQGFQETPESKGSVPIAGYYSLGVSSEDDIFDIKKEKKTLGSTENNLDILLLGGSMKDNFNLENQSKKYKFIRNIGNFIEQGPLTSSEFIRYRSNLEKYLNNANINTSNCQFNFSYNLSALEVQNISSDDKYNLNYEDVFENFRGIDFNKLMLCTTCLRWKVDRAHHCKQCGKCVLKMDHHCPWLANCIGFRNYKFFLLTIFYGYISTLIIFFTFWEVVVQTNLKYESSLIKCTVITFAYMCNFGMLCFLSWLFFTNWNLLFTNQTTIERADKERFATTGIKSFNYYDLGTYRNFTSVFGKFPLFWFVPICPNLKGDGVIFDS